MLRMLVDRLQRRRAAGVATDPPAGILTRSALVVSPHQDDETLGCGGTIALKRRAGAEVTIAFLADGTRSHVPLIGSDELSALRHEEALRAAGRLGVDADHVVFLDLPEGALAAHVDQVTARLAELLQGAEPDDVFVTAAGEPHKDHAAAHAATVAAVERWGGATIVYEYPIWCWYHWPAVPLPLTPRTIGSASRMRYELPRVVANTRSMQVGRRIHTDFPVRVPIRDVLAVKRAALEEHRSQVRRLRSTPRWATLADVGGGLWIERFFGADERFRTSPFGAGASGVRS